MNLQNLGGSFLGGLCFTVGAITAVVIMRLLFHVSFC